MSAGYELLKCVATAMIVGQLKRELQFLTEEARKKYREVVEEKRAFPVDALLVVDKINMKLPILKRELQNLVIQCRATLTPSSLRELENGVNEALKSLEEAEKVVRECLDKNDERMVRDVVTAVMSVLGDLASIEMHAR